MSKIQKPETQLNVDRAMGGDPDDPGYQEPKDVLFTEVPVDDDGIDFGEPEDDGSGDIPGQQQVQQTSRRAAPQQASQQRQQTQEQQFRVRTRTGQVFTGSKDEIIAKMQQSIEHGSLAIEDRESQIREARGQMRQQEERQPGTKGAWDPQKYLDLLGTDPMEARRYQDRHLYGLGENDDPAEMIRFSYQVADQVNDSLAVSMFHQRNPDFPASEENATALLQFIDREGLPVTTRNLEYAFGELRRNGRLRVDDADQQGDFVDLNFETRTPTKVGSRSRGEGAPPAPSGGGGGRTALDAADFDSLSDDELEKEINRRGMKKF